MVTEVKGTPASVVSIDARTAVGQKPPVSTTSPESVGGEVSRVRITSDASILSELEQAVKATPVVDSQRVQALQKALADGSYQMDPRQTADKLLRLESLLGTTQSSGPSGNAG
jgi:negative regulator of flagellin synthesis FlgM